MAGGRPSKLTPDTQKRIIDAIRIGVTYKDAANAAGIHYDTFNEWRKAGEEAASGKYHEFSDALVRAEAEARVGLVANIRGAGKKDWRASAWLLERHDPDTYHLKVKTQISGDRENPVEVNDASLTTDERVDRLAALLDAARDRRDRRTDSDGRGARED